MSSPRKALADLRDSYRFLPPVLREALVTYADRAALGDEPADRVFEHFAAYHVMRNAGLDEIDVSSTLVGGENDTQLDAVAITINGDLVTSAEEVRACLREAIDGEPFDVRFLFAQATMSAKFPSDKVALFSTGVLNFFLPETRLKQSLPLVQWRSLKEQILLALAALGRGRATADVFVVWPGTWTTEGHEAHATGVAEASLSTLKATGILSDVRFHRIDSTRLQGLVIDDTVANAATLRLEGMTQLPAIDGVSFAGLGYATAFDYLACLADGDPASTSARIKHDVFHGNVRAFLGDDTRVNRHIRDSIVGADGGAQAEFALRNNGVTIIAEEVEKDAATGALKLKNFQVVNGCQTSHVLFHNRLHLTPALRLPIKVVATRVPEIAQNIILGLNRQTQIDELQILARNDFVRRLKRHCDVTPVSRAGGGDGERLPLVMFERRTGEFRHVADKDRIRIVTLQEMMQTFAAAFMESPHSVHEGGKGYLLRQVPKRMFADDHDVGFYFASGLLLWRVRQALGSLHEWQAHAAKHHLVFAMRTLADPKNGCPPGRRDGEAHEYLRSLRETLFSDKRASRLATQVLAIVEKAAQLHVANHAQPGELIKADAPVRLTSAMAQRESFSDCVLDLCLAERSLPSVPDKKA
ncbi:MAG: AIPR family protein [Hyphomicrobiaceae bacterium]